MNHRADSRRLTKKGHVNKKAGFLLGIFFRQIEKSVFVAFITLTTVGRFQGRCAGPWQRQLQRAALLHPPARPGLGGEVMRAHRGAGQGRAQGEGGHGLIRGSLITWRSAGAWLGVSTPLRHRRLAALPCPSSLLKSPSEIRRLVLPVSRASF